VLVAAAARARRRDTRLASVDALVDEVFAGAGLTARRMPESVTRTLEALDAARRGTRPVVPVAADVVEADAVGVCVAADVVVAA
jgi:hypothetical protein